MTNLLINGEHRAATGGARFERIDPVTGEVATSAAAAALADVEGAVAAAKAAAPGWAATTPEERRLILLDAASLMSERSGGFAEAMMAEAGATPGWAGFNVHLASSMLREAASMTTQITGEVIPSNKPGTLSMSIRQPRGVCVAIAPWNAPVILGTRALAMPLACGNTLVFKTSELTPRVHSMIGDVLNDAGLPPGVVNVITNAPEDGPAIVAALVRHADVAHVNFTGSTRVGKIIAGLAAENLKPVLLELGGKSPLLVLDDADVEAAVNAAVFGSYMNQGQVCMSTERLIVDESVADEFVERLAARVTGLSAGDPRGDHPLGAMVDERSAERVTTLVEDATSKGAVVVTGGERQGTIVQPGLIDNATPEMAIYIEESFGPVKSVIRVSGEDEAIRVANDTEYGLSAAVFSRDIQRALNVASRIESGICHINGPTVSDEAQVPFGGVKGSGYGRFGGRSAVDEFTTLRWITIEDPGQHYPI